VPGFGLRQAGAWRMPPTMSGKPPSCGSARRAESMRGGTRIGSVLLAQILDIAKRIGNGAPQLTDALFNQAVFETTADFRDATFHGETQFDGAVFGSDAVFNRAAFSGYAGFERVTFRGFAGFGDATFDGDAGFAGAAFGGLAVFGEAAFKRDAGFAGALFRGPAWFGGASFSVDVWFDRVVFRRYAGFERAVFGEDSWFGEATFQGLANFREAEFLQARQIGPVLAHRGLILDAASFGSSVVIEVSTCALCCRGARFTRGVQFRVRWARLALDDTDFTAPCGVTGIPRLASDSLAEREQHVSRAWQRLEPQTLSELPRLLSLRRANVAGLGLSNISLADCRFAGAHSLDLLRLEADTVFALSPARLGWERRRVIADERAWRAGRRSRWAVPWWPQWLGSPPGETDPTIIAGLYRALRKGREDAKDEPGAADFYYGETEMRRRARSHGSDSTKTVPRGQAERGVLTAYWLASGYGLRAWRALAWLAALTLACAVGFHLVGFTRPPQPATYWTSLLYTFRATISLTDDQVNLSPWGQLLQAALRITGPVLLGLALLALRSRVRR
jgi:Pentapeptide repeats (9 copies)